MNWTKVIITGIVVYAGVKIVSNIASTVYVNKRMKETQREMEETLNETRREIDEMWNDLNRH